MKTVKIQLTESDLNVLRIAISEAIIKNLEDGEKWRLMIDKYNKVREKLK